MKEDKLRQIIREEILKESHADKYIRAAQDAYEAVQQGDEREFLMELRSLLHTAESVLINGENLVRDRRTQEALDYIIEAKIILKEIQRNE
jgi:hypothetical protein